ncbi:ribonuclease P protein component [Kineococcus gynurae]|uniref:Ribonuclease P protein component n=1 Tax=Kineococcus gynurae TaxID=452979 RepID=A0ABV5LSZ0_9ACTN
MLPAPRRLRRKDDFTLALRRGNRAGTRRLVLHWFHAGSSGAAEPTFEAHPTRVGFVVSKAVGNSVVRHRTQRQLRHVMAGLLPSLPAQQGLLVVRALPASAGATSTELGADVERGLRRLGLTR